MSRRFIFYTLSVLIVCNLPTPLYGQEEVSLQGRVFDSAGPIAGALVFLDTEIDPEITDHNGCYRFKNLETGSYKIRCEFKGRIVRVAVPVRVNGVSPAECDIFFSDDAIQLEPITVAAEIDSAQGLLSEKRTYHVDSGIRDIPHLIREIPELQLIVSGNETYVGVVGSRPEALEVQLDGRRLNSSLTGKADLSQLPLSAIKKIVFYRDGTGGGSGLSGTIDFITKSEKPAVNLRIDHARAEFGFENYRLTAGAGNSRFGNFNINAESQFRKNDFPYTDYFGDLKTRENAQSFLERLSISGGRYLLGGKLSFSGLFYDNKGGVPGQTVQPSPSASQRKKTISIGADYGRFVEKKIRMELGVSHTRKNLHYLDPDSWIKFDTYYKEEEIQFDLLAEVVPSPEIEIKGALYYRKESLAGRDKLRTANSLGNHSRSVGGGDIDLDFGRRFKWLVFRLSLGAGVNRVGLDNHTSGLAALAISHRDFPHLGIRIYRSRSFRLPGLADLHWKEDVFSLPNPDLKPEKSASRGVELITGLTLQGEWRLTMEYRDSRFTDMIYWRRSQGVKYKPVNINSSDYHGLILTAGYKTPGDILAIDFSRVRSITRNREWNQPYFGKEIVYQPRWVNKLDAVVHHRGAYLHYGIRSSDRRFYLEENTKALAPYLIADLEAGLEMRWKYATVEVRFWIDNFTDETYELVEFQPMPPRTIGAGVGVEF